MPAASHHIRKTSSNEDMKIVIEFWMADVPLETISKQLQMSMLL
jgi:hypothetical protein